MSTKEPWKFPTALTFSNPLPYSVPERVKSISQPSSNCRQSKRRGKERQHQKHRRTHRLPCDKQHQRQENEDNTGHWHKVVPSQGLSDLLVEELNKDKKDK